MTSPTTESNPPAVATAPAGSGSAETVTATAPDRFGYIYLIVTTVLAAVQPVIMRYGAVRIEPLLFCAGTIGSAGAALALVLWRTGELATLADRRYLPRLIALSLLGTVATSLTLIYGLRKIGAVAGVILLQSEPLYSLLVATVGAGERPAPRQLLATATILAGIGSVMGAGRAFAPLYAAVLVFVTPLFWQVSHVISLRVMPPLSITCVTGARYIYAAVFFVIAVVITDRQALAQLADPAILTVMVVLGVVVCALGSFAWYGAISRLSLAWTTALVIPSVPLLSFACAILFLGERPNIHEIIGILIAVSGVVLLVCGADSRRRPRTREAAIFESNSGQG